ncbi:MAG: hypothetical protein IAG13_34710, partial [Deltaproteobacteria bacterium]|nr:hypothetical protein [Nannocystaceae bacterium]
AEAAVRLRGALALAPPAFSAIKQDGVAAHVRARRGEHVELAPRIMQIDEVIVHGRDDARARVEVELAVGKGTYVRAWAVALGEAVGLPAHLVWLRRLASGSFSLDDPRVVGGLHASPRPELSPHGKPKVHIGFEGLEGLEGLDGLDRAGIAARLRAAMIEPIHALPPDWSRALAPDPERFERLCQGLPQWAIAVGLAPEAPVGLGAVAEPSGRRLVLARLAHEDGYLRVFPTRVLHLATMAAPPPASA